MNEQLTLHQKEFREHMLKKYEKFSQYVDSNLELGDCEICPFTKACDVISIHTDCGLCEMDNYLETLKVKNKD